MKKNNPIMTLVSLTFCFNILVFSFVNAQETINHKTSLQGFNESPKLVVGIVVDQMRADYLSRFWNKFSDKGFKRLVNGGYLCENNNINYTQSETGPGHASIYTGATPSINGIVGNDWYSKELNKMVYCVGDSTPNNLFTNTITDQLHLATNFASKVISISLKDPKVFEILLVVNPRIMKPIKGKMGINQAYCIIF